MASEPTLLRDGEFQAVVEYACALYKISAEHRSDIAPHKHLISTLTQLCGGADKALIVGLILGAEHPEVAGYLLEHITGSLAYAQGKDTARIIEAVYEAKVRA